MLLSKDAIALLRAVLEQNCRSDDSARRYLAEAERLATDPLDYAVHQFGLAPDEVWRRAAVWAGYTFASALPSRGDVRQLRTGGLAALATTRSMRRNTLGTDITFVAPAFERVVGLKQNRSPGLVAHLRFCPPYAICEALAVAASDQLMDAARQGTTRAWPEASAALDLPRTSRIVFAGLMAVLVVIAMAAGAIMRPFLIPVVALLLMAPGWLRLIAALPSREPTAAPPLPDEALPTYSVLLPMRDEDQMVPQLARAMSALDYPAHKLDVILVVESASPETVRAAKAVLSDPRFRLVVVPDALPKTKPKAVDYALPLARGELLVIYDAEDVPASDQLRKAAARFAAEPDLACLQAELVPENASENALTMLFAGEYAGLFGRLLPLLARWRLPVPLGGTSNHFRVDILRKLGGWDAFNVTEDADLGVRLARRRLRTATFDSVTQEEAPVSVPAFMAQRTRWMKGWMQTFIVHNRRPLLLLRDLGWRGFAGFQVLVGGMILSSLLHTVFLGSLLARVAVEGVIGFVPRDVWDWFAVGILAAGYCGAFAVQISGLIRRQAWTLLPVQVILPAYWMLHSAATLNAIVDLVRRPDHWAKTTHGVTRLTRETSRPLAAAMRLRPGSG
jgi:cellulose synthase/poly-beta-1,6-N-acetylglucosamine synthase-like glycosyltransferase